MLGALLMVATSLVDSAAVWHGSAFASPRERSESVKQFTTPSGYDAVDQANRRRQPAVNFRSEDEVLGPRKRALIQANSHDLARNFSIAGWAIRRHLDYVTTFELYGKSKDRKFNRDFEAWFWDVAQAPRFDVAGRQSWASGVRMLEAQALLKGDNGLMVLSDGTFQGIESDRVRSIAQSPTDRGKWVHGVKVNEAGKHLAYCIGRRVGNGFEFERTVAAGNMIWHGYYDRWDQIRGVSPIFSALNPLRDVYENFDYALAAAKLRQLFGLVLTRKAVDAAGVVDGVVIDADNPERSQYNVSFGRGPVVLDMDPGDDAKFLESQHPSSQFQDFTKLVTMVALKALDIPFSFYDEAHTNFFGSRGSWLHYERACKPKRDTLAAIQHRMLIRRLQIAILKDEFILPAGANSIAELDWDFVPLGMPWWKPSEEINGDVQSISAGLNNPQRVCRGRGTGDPFENIDATAEVMEYAKEKGVALSFTPSAYQEIVVNGDQQPDAS